MTTDEVLQMLDEAKSLNFVAYVAWGGEPLLRPSVLRILQHTHDLGFYTSIITNGFLLPNKAEEIAKTVDLTWVSLDYHSNYHDQLRGRKDIYKRAIRGIIRTKLAGGRIAINCVVSKLNMNVIRKMAELARKLRVNIAFDPMKIFSGINEEYALSDDEREKSFSEINKLRKMGYPILNSKEFLDRNLGNSKYSCSQPKVFVNISEDGKIQPFWCIKSDNVLGDLHKQSLHEILYSNSFKKFCEVTEGCNACMNSPTVEASIFHSYFFKNLLSPTNLKFFKNFGLKTRSWRKILAQL